MEIPAIAEQQQKLLHCQEGLSHGSGHTRVPVRCRQPGRRQTAGVFGHDDRGRSISLSSHSANSCPLFSIEPECGSMVKSRRTNLIRPRLPGLSSGLANRKVTVSWVFARNRKDPAYADRCSVQSALYVPTAASPPLSLRKWPGGGHCIKPLLSSFSRHGRAGADPGGRGAA